MTHDGEVSDIRSLIFFHKMETTEDGRMARSISEWRTNIFTRRSVRSEARAASANDSENDRQSCDLLRSVALRILTSPARVGIAGRPGSGAYGSIFVAIRAILLKAPRLRTSTNR